jgi:hypothetical protein
MKIKNYLRKLGYRPDLSDGVLDKYEERLFKYLKEERYEEFCEFRALAVSEESIIRFIGDDIGLFKIVLSGQIRISINILDEIISLIKQNNTSPKRILDLGGTDGWAVNFLNEKLQLNSELTVIDKNTLWEPVSENVKILNNSYAEYDTIEKHDLIISILGAPQNGIKELFECIKKSITINGMAIVGLRISNEIDYAETVKLAGECGLIFVTKHCKNLQVFDENIPFIYLENSVAIPNNNDCLRLVRKGYNNLEFSKRLFGYNANQFLELIKDGEIVASDKVDFDNGSMEVIVIEKNEILYRKTSNTMGDIIIEYPVELDKESNTVNKQDERIKSENLWNSSL